MLTNAIAENIVTIIATVLTVLGLYWMGAGAWSFLGLVLLGNINYMKKKTP